MGRVVSNTVTGVQPTIFSQMVQIPLYKRLVALEVANTRFSDTVGVAVTIPRFADLSAQVYTPGTPFSATNQTWTYDTLNISTYKTCAFYVDTPRQQTVNVDTAVALAPQAAYQLGNAIDKFTLAKITGAGGFTYIGIDGGTVPTLTGSVTHRDVSATSANVLNIFAAAKYYLRAANVEEDGTWCAIITPKIAAYLETKLMNVGFSVADATLKNGYAGNVDGFEVYISNNLPSGSVSTLNPAMSVAAVSATTGRALYFGKKKMIDLALLRSPQMEIRPCEDKIGSNYVTWTVYGATLCNKNAARGISVVGAVGNFG